MVSCVAIVALLFAVGCESDSYMNPSVTGYYENTPTTMPVLDRIDVIEAPEVPLGVTGPPEAQDLIANTLQYRLAAGDEVGVEIYELITVGRTESALRIVDQGGYIRLPTINEVKAAGLTLEELREAIRAKLEAFIKNPVVTVDIQKGRSFEFTIAEFGELMQMSAPFDHLRQNLLWNRHRHERICLTRGRFVKRRKRMAM
mgnify:CR=1 FL=1